MHDHAAEASLFKRRALFTFFCVFALLSVLVTNLYHLQVESYKDYETRSNDNRIRVVPIAPSRGLIYDRNGVLLAENLPFYSLDLVPEKISNMSETLDELGKLIEISEDERETFTEALKFHRRFKPLTLKNQLTEEQVAIFSVNQHKFPGISVEAGLKRNYPYGAQITHVLGYVGKINTRDRAQLERSDLWKTMLRPRTLVSKALKNFMNPYCMANRVT